MKTPYSVLHLISPSDTWKDITQAMITQAYRTAVMAYHPDRPQNKDNPEAHEQFLLIQAAYDLLSDPVQRAHYDANPYPFPNDPQDQALMTGKDAALENEARDLISAIFNRYVDKLDAHGAKRFDIQKNMRRELNEACKAMKSQQRACRSQVRKLNVIRHRLSPTPYLHAVLRSKRIANIRTWSAARWQLLVGQRALDILFEVEYQADPDPVNPFGTSTSAYDIKPSVNYNPINSMTFT